MGYNNVRQKIIEALVGRQSGTKILPEKHQEYELEFLDYVRSIELTTSSVLQGYAVSDTVPVQPDNSKVSYIGGVSSDSSITFVNFYDENGQPITVTAGSNEALIIILIWDGQHWSYNTITISSENIVASFWELDKTKTDVSYGRIYTWGAAINPLLTSSDDWGVAKEQGQGGAQTVGFSLLDGFCGGLTDKLLTSGSNEYGFNANYDILRLSNGNFSTMGMILFLSPDSVNNSVPRFAGMNTDGFVYGDTFNNSYPIRLVKENTTLTHGQSGTYVGNDGRVYLTICIGTQEWLACNLAETKLRDGNNIPIISDNNDWSNNLSATAMCAYNNDENNVFVLVDDENHIRPKSSKKIKSENIDDLPVELEVVSKIANRTVRPRWDDPANGVFATDDVNLSLIASGFCNLDGSMGVGALNIAGGGGYYWTRENAGNGTGTRYSVYNSYSDWYLASSKTLSGGYSIRLVRSVFDSEVDLPDGTILPMCYIDYDGNSYEGVKINDKVWLRQNLKTTHFWNGTPIPICSALTVNGNSGYAVVQYAGKTSDEESIKAHGLLYLGYTIFDGHGLVNDGNDLTWQVPSSSEVLALFDYLAIKFPDRATSVSIGNVIKSIYQINSPYIKPTGTDKFKDGNKINLSDIIDAHKKANKSNEYAVDISLPEPDSRIVDVHLSKVSEMSERALKDKDGNYIADFYANKIDVVSALKFEVIDSIVGDGVADSEGVITGTTQFPLTDEYANNGVLFAINSLICSDCVIDNTPGSESITFSSAPLVGEIVKVLILRFGGSGGK